jgi:hypothetical protein
VAFPPRASQGSRPDCSTWGFDPLADDKPIPESVRATFLVEPATPDIVVALKQYNLRGNKLRTFVLDPKVVHLNETRHAMYLQKHFMGYVISNLDDHEVLVEVCPSTTNRCAEPPEEFSVPPDGSLNVTNPDYVAPADKPNPADPVRQPARPLPGHAPAGDARPDRHPARGRGRQALSGAQA